MRVCPITVLLQAHVYSTLTTAPPTTPPHVHSPPHSAEECSTYMRERRGGNAAPPDLPTTSAATAPVRDGGLGNVTGFSGTHIEHTGGSRVVATDAAGRGASGQEGA